MAFQQFQFRLAETPIIDTAPTHSTFPTNPNKSVNPTKQPYGSGDTDDGYTLVFTSLAEFQAWREQEEESNMVEFVKGDTHGSKAIPPRFKDHTKLVCARHSRSGRKKYVKKHPDRVRKVPSRKLEGQGCPASISYKTYFDTEEVRACYISQHSHEIGLANLPFTRRGRKAVVEREKEKRTTVKNVTSPPNSSSAATTVAPTSVPPPDTPTTHLTSPQPMTSPTQQHIQQQQQQHVQHIPQPPQQSQHHPQQQHQPQPQQQQQQVDPSSSTNQQMTFTSAVSMLAPLPGQPVYATAPHPQAYGQPYGLQYATLPQPGVSNERWDNMSILFNTVRDHARTFEYPSASVAALETVLIRLYLESPMGNVGAPPAANLGQIMMTHVMNRGATQQQHVGGQNAGNDGTLQNDGNS